VSRKPSRENLESSLRYAELAAEVWRAKATVGADFRNTYTDERDGWTVELEVFKVGGARAGIVLLHRYDPSEAVPRRSDSYETTTLDDLIHLRNNILGDDTQLACAIDWLSAARAKGYADR